MVKIKWTREAIWDIMIKITNYLSRLFSWLFETFQISIVIFSSSIIYLFREDLGKEGIELCGGIMQIIGTIFGIVVFFKIREAFYFPPLEVLFKNWIKRFPRWRNKTFEMSVRLNIPSIISSGSLTFWMPDDINLPIEERLSRIVKNQESLRKNLEKALDTISKQENGMTARIENLSVRFNSDINQLNSKLESIHMEDFLWALTGLLFILMGTLFSSFANYLV